jgi:hypothetical protein
VRAQRRAASFQRNTLSARGVKGSLKNIKKHARISDRIKALICLKTNRQNSTLHLLLSKYFVLLCPAPEPKTFKFSFFPVLLLRFPFSCEMLPLQWIIFPEVSRESISVETSETQ